MDVEKVRAALAKVQDPLFGKDIVALGYVKDLLGDGDKARITLKLPTPAHPHREDRKSTRLNSSHGYISYAVFCLKKKKTRRMYLRHKNRVAFQAGRPVASTCS